MRILHCLETLDPAAGGPARSVPQLALAQAQLGHEVGVWTKAEMGKLKAESNNQQSTIANLQPEVSSSSIQHFSCLSFAEALVRFGIPEIVHDHGIWLPFHRQIASECVRRGIPRLVSPRGMLEPWALNHKKWKKKLAWWLYQRRNLHSAVALHATAESEAEQLRKLGFKQKIIVAGNGVAVPKVADVEFLILNEFESLEHLARKDSETSSIQNPKSKIQNPKRTALFLSRIHPKKGLPMLLETWARLRPEGWCLQIVGPDEGGHVEELKRLCQKLKLEWLEGEATIENRNSDVGHRSNEGDADVLNVEDQMSGASKIQHSKSNIHFSGPIDGQAKWDLMRSADLFILPTYSENFGIAVAEALACGLPVITTTGAPWAGLVEHRCGWWVEPTQEALRNALTAAISLSDAERTEMGRRGASWVGAEFAWRPIATKMLNAYQEILGRFDTGRA